MRKLITICMVVILSVAGTANAVITFSEFPVGTAVGNHYQPQGVIFLAGIVTPALPIIDWNGAMPTQPILRPDGAAGGLFMYAGDFSMQFTVPQTSVQFDSGYWDMIGSAIIDVYDPGMILLASLTNTMIGVEQITIGGLGPIGTIYFNSVADPAGGDIDNLAFPIPAPGAILLGGLGVGVFGWLRRRKAI